MSLSAKIKQFRWYNIPSYLLNQFAVGDHAYCHKDLQYASSDRQKLDLYIPKQPRSDGALMLFVHGGSWQNGTKDDYIFLAQNMAKAGFYVACINYRLAPNFQFPKYVEDCILASNWLLEQKQVSAYGYNRNKVILFGHSAGAFNIMSAVYHPSSFSMQISKPEAIYALIGVAGPYSFEHRGDPLAAPAFEQTTSPDMIMPDRFIYKNQIKHLLILASKDTLVADSNTEHLQSALLEKGNQVDVIRIAKTTHVSVIATLARGLDKIYPTQQIIQQWIDSDE